MDTTKVGTVTPSAAVADTALATKAAGSIGGKLLGAAGIAVDGVYQYGESYRAHPELSDGTREAQAGGEAAVNSTAGVGGFLAGSSYGLKLTSGLKGKLGTIIKGAAWLGGGAWGGIAGADSLKGFAESTGELAGAVTDKVMGNYDDSSTLKDPKFSKDLTLDEALKQNSVLRGVMKDYKSNKPVTIVKDIDGDGLPDKMTVTPQQKIPTKTTDADGVEQTVEKPVLSAHEYMIYKVQELNAKGMLSMYPADTLNVAAEMLLRPERTPKVAEELSHVQPPKR